jgi:hypothetical protein
MSVTMMSAVRWHTAGLVALALGLLSLLAGCTEGSEPVWLVEKGKVYCYRTLAEPDCYALPLRGAEERLIAVGPQVYFRPL